MNDHSDKLDEVINESDDYYLLIDFTNSMWKFSLIDQKTEQKIQIDFHSTFNETLGICDECCRTNDECRCNKRWQYYDDVDDEYDLYNDR